MFDNNEIMPASPYSPAASRIPARIEINARIAVCAVGCPCWRASDNITPATMHEPANTANPATINAARKNEIAGETGLFGVVNSLMQTSGGKGQYRRALVMK